jgi:hypothetical protein
MKMTVVTQQGNVVGLVYGHMPKPSPTDFREGTDSSFRGGLMAGPGQEIHVIEATERLLAINSPKELIAEVTSELKKHK